MQPGNKRIVKCPHCGGTKELMSLRSGNTFGARFWSDGKRLAPMLPQASPVQKCPDCGKYYLLYQQEYTYGDGYSNNRGELNYAEWKEALAQFAEEDLEKADQADVRLGLIHAFNDQYHRGGGRKKPSQKETDFINTIIGEFIKLFNWRKVELPLLKAELYREMGEMKKCARVLAGMEQKPMKKYEKALFEGIKERMEKDDRKVFQIKP